MKRTCYLLTALLLALLPASAQVKAYRAASVPTGTSVAYSLPRTVLKVTLVVEKESVRRGPYSRFAQKYLGVMAPSVDKDLYAIVDARIACGEEADPTQVYVLDNPDKSAGRIYDLTPEGFLAATMEGAPVPAGCAVPPQAAPLRAGIEQISYVASDTSFLRLPIDKRSSVEQSVETMAQQAAGTIFNLRKRRVELVTGEFGENVFGAGLADALREIDRLEQEYTALFLGKQYRERIVRTYDVIPEGGKPTAVVCRFSEQGGLLAQSDLTGTPVVVELAPEKKLESSPWAHRTPAKDTRGLVYYRIADMVDCRLTDRGRELTACRLPIYQFGLVVEVPAASLK